MPELLSRFWHHRLLKALLLSWFMALGIAATAQATTDIPLDNGQTVAIVLLGLTTLALSIYLFVVIVQPERF
jgi:K+-transporting ATPase KdpF subunit